ncbi:MAG: hypothetical protein HKN30_07935 [Sulfitobacter sp.]|nr:hypothetical protein [Sulfitobacter sp.]
MLKIAAPLLGLLLALPVSAQTLQLKPANPQPSAGSLARGLAVIYAYPSKLRTIADAKKGLSKGKRGPALAGLSYLDGAEGEIALTSKAAMKVAASIKGYMKFDAPGTYQLEVISNDGVLLRVGGKQVAFNDGIHACESAGVTSVQVPSAGWYELEATYFQRKGTSCLLMDWNKGGGMEPVPDSAFAYKR